MFITYIVKNILEQGTLSRLINFTDIIKYMYVHQSNIIELINFMLVQPNISLIDVITVIILKLEVLLFSFRKCSVCLLIVYF